MKIQRTNKLWTISLAVWCITSFVYASNDTETQILFKNYSKFLNDVSDRRSRVVYTPYPASVTKGFQHGFVHVTDGTVAFSRIDLMVDASMPLVLKRVYSSTRQGIEFGTSGWGLSILETIEQPKKDRLIYTYGNGKQIVATGRNANISAFDTATSDVLSISVAQNNATVITRTGLTKTFMPRGGLYLLHKAVDTFGNFIELKYDDNNMLFRIESSEESFIEITRNDDGFVTMAKDNIGRTVNYRYNAADALFEHEDIRGETWLYSYRPNGLLETATTPNGLIDVALTYRADKKALTSEVNGFEYAYEYQVNETTVTDDLGITRYRAAPNGMTRYVENAVGTITEVQTDGTGRPTHLIRNDNQIANVSYRAGAVGDQPTVMHGTENGTDYGIYYDGQGRIIRLAIDDVTNFAVKEYSFGLTPSVISLADTGGTLTISHDTNGQLSSLDFLDGSTMTFLRNRALWDISDGQKDVQLTFGLEGHLESASIGEDDRIRYWYDDGGFRKETVASTGAIVTYNYDASGSLFYTSTGYEGHPIEGFRYIPNENNAITEVITTTGRSVNIEYGDNGLPFKFTSDELTDLTFHHDDLGRLESIDREGMATISYSYESGESDIVLQNDTRSATVFSQHRDNVEFGSRLQTWMSRIMPTEIGVFAFSPSTKEIGVPLDVETWNPASPLHHSIKAMQLHSLFAEEPDFASFSLPSNRLFVPKELWSVNCCFCDCVIHNASCAAP